MSQPIQSVLNAFAVLEAVAGSQPVGLSETARLTGLPKTTVLRCLLTLQEAGWLLPSSDGRSAWSLTNKSLLMGMRSAPAGDLATLVQGELSTIRETVGETVHLLVRDADAQVVVSRADGVNAIRTYLALGTRVPFHSTASGRAMLAAMPADQRAHILDEEASQSDFDREEVERHVTAAITRGYAINYGEWRDDVAGVGVVVFGSAGELRAAISVSLPAARLEEIGAESVADVLLASQRRLSQILR